MPKPITFKPLLALVASLLFASSLPAFAADALVTPVPTPDLSKLPPEKAADLQRTRQEFDKVKATLAGDPLAQAHALLGAAYARAGFYDAAMVALDDAAQLAPGDGRWLYSQGIVARLQKQNAAAQSYFERALTLNQQYLPIRMAVVNVRLEQGDLENARKLLSDFTATHASEPVAFATLGEIALRQKRYADAIEQTNKALAIDPKATRLYTQLADAYAGAGNAKAAADARAKVGDGVPALGDPIGLGLLEQRNAAVLKPGAAAAAPPAPAPAAAPPAGDSVAQATREASFLLTTRQYDATRLRLDAGLKLKPNDPELLGLYARADAASGNLAQAKTRAEAAVAANPNYPRAQLTLGYVMEVANDDAAAQRAYERATAMNPKLGEANINLGNLLMRNGRFDDAAARYRAAAQAEPSDGEAWTRLAAAQVAAGKCAPALKETNDALAKDANNGYLMQLFVRLTSTCAGSGAEEKRMALDYAGKLYRQTEAAPIGETYALAFAANGKWDDAIKTQQAAMFVLVRNGRSRDLPPYREFLQQFQAHKLPDRPWAADNPLMKPLRPVPDPKPVAAPPPAPPKK